AVKTEYDELYFSLCRTIKTDPSEIIQTILDLREGQQSEARGMTPSRMQHLGDLVREAQASYEEIAELTLKLKNRLEAVKTEYDELYFSLSRKEEEE
ncbi:MAG: hypothetical protein JSV18_05255, partial [Candidatus Bathyarchaeota archaeon]